MQTVPTNTELKPAFDKNMFAMIKAANELLTSSLRKELYTQFLLKSKLELGIFLSIIQGHGSESKVPKVIFKCSYYTTWLQSH